MSDAPTKLLAGAPASVQVARRPILGADERHEVLGYALMFSDPGDLFSAFSAFTDVDEFRATSEVLSHSVLTLGVEAVVGSARAFMKFPRAQVVDSTPLIMPPHQSVIEVGRDTWAARDREGIISRLEGYRDVGYEIALSDFFWTGAAEPLVALAQYVKVDVNDRLLADARAVIDPIRALGARVIAVNVDTTAARDAAVAAGADFLEGYFYSTPEVVRGRALPGYKLAYLQLLRKAYAVDVDFGELADVVKSDVALTYKLLRYVNSAAFGLRQDVTSVEQALALLGADNVRRWVSVATVGGLASPRPQELAVLCVTRARFCESLGRRLGIATAHACFSVGMFSLLDVMLGKDLEDALADVPLGEDVAAALRREPGVLTELLDVVVAYERGQWSTVSQAADRYGWPETELIGLYIEAIEWSRDFFGVAGAA